ncbi:potassium transport protein kefC [Haladaptatus paucihalophilus DX253]|uniref:Potassium transport protein kefC n=1 Tax=Haladaptatus paucihalophilus DX253 TaxID=797209 RepID=E7QV32_HALPU|nr:cation:proton antiporter [Haladaptatus paucihalophilus]EFW91550.1 potassium transport protein kefC [Haladaptatus paucihalophilus DX253]SHL24938.1 sodium/proton antiporter, CPA1 family [Haladaptatus paucihalophilus DX253]
MSSNLLLVSASIIALGAVSKLLADRYGIPNVVFLLGFGILFGPEGVGLVDPQLFDDSLSALVSLAVAIIIFEGAFTLGASDIRETPKSTLRLVTVGAGLTFFALGGLIHVFLSLDWNLSFLISALLVATGPTVITPVLDQIEVREGVRTLLETEGVVNDVTASVLGAVIFSVAVLDIDPDPVKGRVGLDVVLVFVARIGTGVLIGIVTALVAAYVLRYLSQSPQDSRITVIGTALISFAIADAFVDEAGVVTVAVAGLILGSVDIPYDEEIAGFSGDITSIVLSVVYIILASLLELDHLLTLGTGGLAIVVLTMLVVRPLSVLISTTDTQFTRNERLFVAAVGPRGIIPASTATLFSLQLANAGVPNATSVVHVVFLVILVTAVVEAGGAPLAAKALDIIPMTVLIIGGSRTGRLLADRLEERGENPIIVERDDATVTELRAAGYSVVPGNGTNAAVLEEAGTERAKMVVAATSDDDQNILACQTARTTFGIQRLIAQVNKPENADAFSDLGVQPVTPVTATVDMMDGLILRPNFYDWLTGVGDENDIAEVVVESKSATGQQVQDIELRDDAVIALVRRDGEFIVPNPNVVVQEGDLVTLIGNREAVERSVAMLE